MSKYLIYPPPNLLPPVASLTHIYICLYHFTIKPSQKQKEERPISTTSDLGSINGRRIRIHDATKSKSILLLIFLVIVLFPRNPCKFVTEFWLIPSFSMPFILEFLYRHFLNLMTIVSCFHTLKNSAKVGKLGYWFIGVIMPNLVPI